MINNLKGKLLPAIVTGLAAGITATVVIAAALFLLPVTSNASSAADVGSEADPAVSKSYVDQRVNEIMVLLNSTGVKQSGESSEGFYPVSVTTGSTIFGGEGCEMLLRSGVGRAVASTDGITDVTQGADLKNNAEIPKNHLLIFPRADGRGVKVIEDAWFLIRGSYSLD